jgi:membrane associated rhomboid family serine protease
MLALWFVGAAVEISHGWLASMIIFTLSAVGGMILSAIFLPEYISVGASAGIFGG